MELSTIGWLMGIATVCNIIGVLLNILLIYITYIRDRRLLATDLLLICLSMVKIIESLVSIFSSFFVVYGNDNDRKGMKQPIYCIDMILQGLYLTYFLLLAILQYRAVKAIMRRWPENADTSRVVKIMFGIFLVLSIGSATAVILGIHLENAFKESSFIQSEKHKALISFIPSIVLLSLTSILYGINLKNLRHSIRSFQPAFPLPVNNSCSSSEIMYASMWSIAMFLVGNILPYSLYCSYKFTMQWTGTIETYQEMLLKACLLILNPIGMGICLKRKRQNIRKILRCKTTRVSIEPQSHTRMSVKEIELSVTESSMTVEENVSANVRSQFQVNPPDTISENSGEMDDRNSPESIPSISQTVNRTNLLVENTSNQQCLSSASTSSRCSKVFSTASSCSGIYETGSNASRFRNSRTMLHLNRCSSNLTTSDALSVPRVSSNSRNSFLSVFADAPVMFLAEQTMDTATLGMTSFSDSVEDVRCDSGLQSIASVSDYF